tara:strand:+ start:655 stop:963 length:309 start_codon:yes stop_codon:yes gene_type:complete
MIIYVDIDGTICSHSAKNENGEWDYTLAKPRNEQIEKINKLYNEGHEIVYWTARGSGTGKDWSKHTKQQIDNWGCCYNRIETQKKPVFDLFIDDKSKRIEEI